MVQLSVLLITFNNENYIEETLKSILKQRTSFNFEIVVGDDNSSDKTLDIIYGYKTLHPQHLFNIKKNKNQLGILKNFKTTLDRCKGDYIFDIAGDDILKSEYALQKMVNAFLNDSSIGFVDSGYDKLQGNKIIPYTNKLSIQASKKVYKEFICLGKIIPIGFCFNKTLLYQYVDFDHYIEQSITIEDYPILVDLTNNSDFHRINESLHVYRIHKESYSHKPGLKRSLFQRNQMYNLFNYFKIKYSFSQSICKTFEQVHYKALLRLAGSYERKEIGKEVYSQIESKTIYDTIHYYASQYKTIRNIAKIRKNKNLLLKKTRLLFKSWKS